MRKKKGRLRGKEELGRRRLWGRGGRAGKYAVVYLCENHERLAFVLSGDIKGRRRIGLSIGVSAQ